MTMPKTPTELLAEFTAMLRTLGPRSPIVAQALEELLAMRGEIADQAIRVFKGAVAAEAPALPPPEPATLTQPVPPPPPPAPPGAPPQRSRLARWAHDLLGVFSTQTGKNSLIGLVVVTLTVLGVKSVTPAPMDV